MTSGLRTALHGVARIPYPTSSLKARPESIDAVKDTITVCSGVEISRLETLLPSRWHSELSIGSPSYKERRLRERDLCTKPPARRSFGLPQRRVHLPRVMFSVVDLVQICWAHCAFIRVFDAHSAVGLSGLRVSLPCYASLLHPVSNVGIIFSLTR